MLAKDKDKSSNKWGQENVMTYKKTIIFLVVIFATLAAAWYFSDVPEKRSDHTSMEMSDLSSPELSGTEKWVRYHNADLGFSFRHPPNLTISSFEDGPALVVLAAGSGESGFQIYITPFDEPTETITTKRIKLDLPNITINNPHDATIGVDPVVGRGVTFIGDDPTFGGQSREVWFIFNHHLYQIRTYKAYDSLMQAVLETWKFE